MRTGDLYFNTVDSSVYVYDGTSWIVASGGGGGASIDASATAPASPDEGDAWFNTAEGRLYVYYDSFWIEVGANGGAIGPQGPQGETGVVAATSPIQYNAETRTVSIDQSSITIAQSQVNNLVTDLGNKAAASDLTSHTSATTNVHGISNTADLATKSYADSAATSAVAAVIDAAPETLNTLNELAAALGDDPNFATSTATALGNRVRFDAAQTLDDTQKAQARTNIGALSSGSGAVGSSNLANGAVTNEKLANASITINGSSVSLGGSVSITGESFHPFLLMGA